jgi:hypothetical protein
VLFPTLYAFLLLYGAKEHRQLRIAKAGFLVRLDAQILRHGREVYHSRHRLVPSLIHRPDIVNEAHAPPIHAVLGLEKGASLDLHIEFTFGVCCDPTNILLGTFCDGC